MFDIDLLIDPFAIQADGAALRWPAIRAAWLSVAEGLASGGMPTVLLGPLAPFHFDQLPRTGWVSSMHFFLLDCSDVVRRERLDGRPAWRKREIEEQTRWGRWLRENIHEGVDTGGMGIEETVGSIAAWVRTVLRTA